MRNVVASLVPQRGTLEKVQRGGDMTRRDLAPVSVLRRTVCGLDAYRLTSAMEARSRSCIVWSSTGMGAEGRSGKGYLNSTADRYRQALRIAMGG